jgi:prephenate dehydratase
VKENIQDLSWNTTRFFVVVPKDSKIEFKEKKWKTSIIFQARNIPASLYKCLWAFATNHVNLTKIESMPSFKDAFSYIFWIDIEWSINDENVKNSLQELEFFTNEIKVLGEY